MEDSIGSEHLELRELTADALKQMLAGHKQVCGATLPGSWPDEEPDERSMLEYFLGRVEEDPTVAPWSIRMMIRTSDRVMIGHIGFHGPPADGFLEPGYTVFEPYRRSGYAIEAIEALLAAAHESHGVERFRVAISAANAPSLALATRVGFTFVGERVGDDGDVEILYERNWP